MPFPFSVMRPVRRSVDYRGAFAANFGEAYTEYEEFPVSTKAPCIGDYAGWIFHAKGVEEPFIYHHLVPYLYDPATQIAPMLAALAPVAMPVTWERLNSHVRVPSIKNDSTMVGPRFLAVPRLDTPNTVIPPHTGVVDRFDLLLWTFWDRLSYGRYTRPGGRRRGPADKEPRNPIGGVGPYRNGAANVWTVVEGDDVVKVGFVAYDEFGKPVPYWNVEPCPIPELIDQLGTTSRIAFLSKL